MSLFGLYLEYIKEELHKTSPVIQLSFASYRNVGNRHLTVIVSSTPNSFNSAAACPFTFHVSLNINHFSSLSSFLPRSLSAEMLSSFCSSSLLLLRPSRKHPVRSSVLTKTQLVWVCMWAGCSSLIYVFLLLHCWALDQMVAVFTWTMPLYPS